MTKRTLANGAICHGKVCYGPVQPFNYEMPKQTMRAKVRKSTVKKQCKPEIFGLRARALKLIKEIQTEEFDKETFAVVRHGISPGQEIENRKFSDPLMAEVEAKRRQPELFRAIKRAEKEYSESLRPPVEHLQNELDALIKAEAKAQGISYPEAAFALRAEQPDKFEAIYVKESI